MKRRLSARLYSSTLEFGGLERGLQVVGASLARTPPLQLLAHLPAGTRLRTSWLAGYTLCHYFASRSLHVRTSGAGECNYVVSAPGRLRVRLLLLFVYSNVDVISRIGISKGQNRIRISRGDISMVYIPGHMLQHV